MPASPAPDPFPFPPPDMLSSGPPSATPPTAPASPSAGGEFDPFGGPGAGPASVAQGGPRRRRRPATPPAQPILVPSPRFPLQYAVEDAGPERAGDGRALDHPGRRPDLDPAGDDPDRVSPFQVDLGGEGTFGLRLVARSASGLGDQPPGPGDPPQMMGRGRQHAAGRPARTRPRSAPGRTSARSRSTGGRRDLHLGRQAGRDLLAARPARRALAADRRADREHRPVHLDRAAERPAAVPPPGRRRRHRGQPRLRPRRREGARSSSTAPGPAAGSSASTPAPGGRSAAPVAGSGRYPHERATGSGRRARAGP